MKYRHWLGPLLKIFGTNWITLFGANLTTISAVAIAGFLLLGALGVADSPYIALMALMVLPGVFVFGLLLIPVGVIWERRRRAGGAPEGSGLQFPVIDLNHTRTRRITGAVGVLTIINVLIISLVSYEGVAYMDSTEFCGQVCHTVMEPEFAAYQNSVHSRVKCVECHIGPGAPWFVRSKLSGMGQVIAVTLDNYERPIPTPVHNLRPSQVICEQCHWPGRFTGDRVRVITRFAEDEANTPLKTVLLMHIGGGDREEGIHSWHIKGGRETYYVASDSRRQEIASVQVHEDGVVTEFKVEGVEAPTGPENLRKMDCIDCHNRPTHVFKLPAEAMDEALEKGRIDRSIPYIKKVGVEVLTTLGKDFGPVEEISRRVREFYAANHSDFASAESGKIDAAIAEMEAVYRRNIYPDMKLTWGNYPNNIGHQSYPGCFRCHDGNHTSADGRTVEQDCTACHTILAMEEENPEILGQLELE